MKTLLVLLASILSAAVAFAASPSSINNDDSCDIKVGPAATLLLPYFEVDINGTSGQTTLFTITNVTRYPQIAHVTLWTDWAYAVLSFNLYLTGYDIQAINLADVLIRGRIAPPSGTGPATSSGSLSTSTNPNIRSPLDCAGTSALLPPTLLAAARSALTTGVFNPGAGTTQCSTTGGPHDHAIGYATIDVVSSCTTLMPSDPAYYANDLLFDNVLIGDYQQLGASPAGTGAASAFDAAGNAMVHIRAVPEGGGAGANVATNLPYTFYDRYTPSEARTIDRRQPLPSTFAARYIEGGPSRFMTGFTIWRESNDGFRSSCASNINNSRMSIADAVRFDEHENAFAMRCSTSPDGCDSDPVLQVASITPSDSRAFPPPSGTDVGGWFYLNLNNGGSLRYSSQINLAPIRSRNSGPRPSQNWVTISMFGTVAGSRITAEFDAVPLGNGCSPAAFQFFSGILGLPSPTDPPIAPAGGVFVCPPGTTLTNGTTTLCNGTNVNPNP